MYDTYAAYLMGVCMRYVCDKDTAQDLLHDGFLQILTHMDRFRYQGPGSLKAWLTQVQRNVVLKYLRDKDLLADSVSIDLLPDVVADEPNPEVVKDIPQRVLMELISQLPVGFRTVFNLYVIDGYSHKEIARMLGIGEKSSSSQFIRARRALAMKINHWRKENL